MSIQKAVNMEDCLRKLRMVSETLEEYGDPESESLSMLIDDCIYQDAGAGYSIH